VKPPVRKFLYSLGIPSIFIPGLLLAATLGWNWHKDLARLGLQGGIYQNQDIFPKEGIVERAIDGDTIELSTDQTVRLLGTQAPERGHPLFNESTKYLEKLVLNKNVSLEYETVDNMDKYGRLVAYVYPFPNPPTRRVEAKHPSGVMLNAQMLSSGLAKFLYYSHYKKYKYFDELKEAENQAKSAGLGLWR